MIFTAAADRLHRLSRTAFRGSLPSVRGIGGATVGRFLDGPRASHRFPEGFSEAKNEGQCCTVVAERVRARQDRNPNPSRLRAGNHVIDQSALVAERPQHHRPARIYFQSHILGGGNGPGYGPRLIAAENAAIAFPAGLSGANYFFGGSSRGSKTRSCRR